MTTDMPLVRHTWRTKLIRWIGGRQPWGFGVGTVATGDPVLFVSNDNGELVHSMVLPLDSVHHFVAALEQVEAKGKLVQRL